jgi:hypothetical protein
VSGTGLYVGPERCSRSTSQEMKGSGVILWRSDGGGSEEIEMDQNGTRMVAAGLTIFVVRRDYNDGLQIPE